MNRVKIAINGFGRIGRSFFRATFGEKGFDIVAINDLTPLETSAYLLTHDSVYGKYKKTVTTEEGAFVVDGEKIKSFAEKDPKNLPWKDLDIDIVVESSGFFASGEKSQAHLDAGAKRVVITAPASGEVDTLLIGANDAGFANAKHITCNASCTTNATAPIVAILDEEFGIVKSAMTTIHAYTATQKLVDGGADHDVRRSRAAGINIVPASTGAAEAVIQSLPHMEGIFDAVSVRVPVIAGSLVDLTALLKKKTNVEEVNAAFRNAAKNPRWEKVLKTTEDKIVSTDIIGEPYGAIVDLSLTKVIDGDLVKIFSWYDNEAGYTATLVEHVRRIAENL